MAKKIAPLSGFPEWLPEQRVIELHVLDRIRSSFESFGFTSIETRAVEPLDRLLAKGETDKEIYVLRRLHAGADEGDTDLGLHYDLTVPFARYVLQNRGRLQFPFKRYQIQKAWRGERPQEGRYREFCQADIDVVTLDDLPLHFDAEMPLLLHEVLSSLPFPPITIHVNNRKLLEGFYRGLGIEDVHAVLRAVDKVDKMGEPAVSEWLVEELGLGKDVARRCLEIGRITSEDLSFTEKVRALGDANRLLDQGLEELAFVMEAGVDLPPHTLVASLRIARGFDYYTGTVYEGVMLGHQGIGTVCSGGRYDDLVGGHGDKVKIPGVGVSIGVSRILGRLFGKELLSASRTTPTCVLVALPAEETRGAARDVARALRSRGVPTEVFHEPVRYGKQIKYADRKGIPYVWFPPDTPAGGHEVRDIRTGDQAPADPAAWAPPDDDLELRVTLAE